MPKQGAQIQIFVCGPSPQIPDPSFHACAKVCIEAYAFPYNTSIRKEKSRLGLLKSKNDSSVANG